MSDAQKRMTGVLRVHQYNGAAEGTLGARSEFCTCGWSGPGEQVHEAHQAAEIDKALGGLTRETVDKPEFRETGEMVRSPLIDGPEFVPEKRLHFIPSERWVTDWREVQS